MFFAILPKISKNMQKSSIFAGFLSKMLLCKCSSGHVESGFDNPAENFPVKTQVFLFKVQKRRWSNCSRVFFVTSFHCMFRLLFRNNWLIFYQNQKKLTQSPEKDDKSINYFCHFLSKFCWGHVKSLFGNPSRNFFHFFPLAGYFGSETENVRTITFLSKKPSNVPLDT